MNPINYSPTVASNKNSQTTPKKKQSKLFSTVDDFDTQPIISTLRTEDPYYFSISNIVYGDYGKSIPKWKTKEFCAAAEEYALYGRLQIESDFKPTKSEMANFFPKYLNDDQNCGMNIHKKCEDNKSTGDPTSKNNEKDVDRVTSFENDPSILKIGSKVTPSCMGDR
jgi:hypothetical protein